MPDTSHSHSLQSALTLRYGLVCGVPGQTSLLRGVSLLWHAFVLRCSRNVSYLKGRSICPPSNVLRHCLTPTPPLLLLTLLVLAGASWSFSLPGVPKGGLETPAQSLQHFTWEELHKCLGAGQEPIINTASASVVVSELLPLSTRLFGTAFKRCSKQLSVMCLECVSVLGQDE